MFFLGGINSVLPYIIYLSLIWVFLIVGFSGKVMQARHLFSHRTYHNSEKNLHLYDQKVIWFYDHSSAGQLDSSHKTPAYSAWNFFFPSEITAGLHVPRSFLAVYRYDLSAFGLRGPPACFLS